MLSRPVIQWMALSDGPTTSVTLPSLPSIAGGLSLPAGSYYWQLQSFLSENTSYDALESQLDLQLESAESALLNHRHRRPHGRRLSLLQCSLPSLIAFFDFTTRHVAFE